MTADRLLLGFYLAVTLAVGYLAAKRRRKGLEDYVLAGRTLTLPLFVASLVTTFYGGVLGVGEYSWSNGLSNWLVMGAPYYLFAGVYAFFFAGKIRVKPGLTIPDHLAAAYGKPLAVLGALLLFLMLSPADDLLMLGVLFKWATGWPLGVCMIAAAAAALGYLCRGGLRAGVWTNGLQLVVMFVGFFLILPFAYLKLGGLSYLRSHLPPAHLTLTGGKGAGYLLAWFFIAAWTIIDPTFHQRACAAKDPATARKGILLSIAFWFVFDFMTTTAGLYARALLPDLADPILAYPALAQRLMPPLALGLFLAGVCSSMLASLEGRTLLAAVSLAKDGLGRALDAPEAAQERWSRWTVLLAGGVGLALAAWVPSVVGLWYAVGSTINPALLLPFLSVYFPALRVPRRYAFASTLGAWLVSSAWFAAGNLHPPTPLGIEPMYPGLAVSFLIWGAGWLRAKSPSPSMGEGGGGGDGRAV